ncbi:MAG: tRNA uridine(34) 5-carboxymethylaminomethyl modification radical SAM/GNAT enzyme Elp3 [Thaumarchaeota archaeon]|nr:tRNA uridine(34) 5-carboxymethylaminomethyl modification radical SAM/GNAT enzyme Elp3 [Nitrososphaerota archaeon]
MTTASTSIDPYREACTEIANILASTPQIGENNLTHLRKIISIKYGLTGMPSNSAIMSLLPPEHQERLRSILQTKPVRSASGIAVIAAMTKPFRCPPQAQCTYCPGGPEVNTPKSYTGTEPATMRGKQFDYDPYLQTESRIKQLENAGHRVSKAEIIIIGGTFLSYPPSYQQSFVKGCFDALNNQPSTSLTEAHRINETAKVRNVGVTVETRPDFCKQRHIDMMLKMGVTRVEIGVQHPDDEIYRLIKRGHTVQDVVESFQISRDTAYKICAHMMPGLPGSTPKKDLESFRLLFEDPRFKPDMVKIYPTLVVESSQLYKTHQDGLYEPYDIQTTINLIADVKRFVPPWLRIMRVQREIPAGTITAGVKKSNLRQLALEEAARRGYACRCIRCREAGLKQLKEKVSIDTSSVKLLRKDYNASDGQEVFLSYEDVSNDALIGFIRIRNPSQEAHRPEIDGQATCLIRELHIYGPTVPVGQNSKDGWQHRGYGQGLIGESERIAKEEFGADKMLIISAIGTREYYRKLGYNLEGPYMVKRL